MKWEKIEKYPYFIPKACTDNRVQMFNVFIKYFEFDRVSDNTTVESMERLLKGKRSYNNTSYKNRVGFDKVPNHDHAKLFKKQGTNKIVYVHHPYEYNLQELEEWCSKRDLIYVVMEREDSFYYPGHSHMILIMSNDTYASFYNHYGFLRTFYTDYCKGLEVY
jgi:hypothetical protein